MKNKNQQIVIHIACCIIFIVSTLILSPERKSVFDVFINPQGQKYFIDKLLILVFFYFNFLVLIPRFYFERKYLTYIASVLACFVLIIFLPNLLVDTQGLHMPPPSNKGFEMQPFRPKPNILFFRFSQNFFLFLSALFLSLIIQINNRWRNAEKEKLNTELSYLKAQINPHFLFNTLNSIYSLAIEKSDFTPTAIVKLSGMMRYVVSEADHNMVSLQKEIDYISDYIELQKLRFGHIEGLAFTINGNPSGKQIAPLILIPFIENAFKYGVNSEEDSVIRILIDISDQELRMEVFNKKVKQPQKDEEQSGLGISNTKNRLQLLYPGSHSLSINNNPKDFDVHLSVKLN